MTRERYRGALLGLAAGDALGTTLEFKPPGTFAPLADMIGVPRIPYNIAQIGKLPHKGRFRDWRHSHRLECREILASIAS
jgi:hypothetical protein